MRSGGEDSQARVQFEELVALVRGHARKRLDRFRAHRESKHFEVVRWPAFNAKDRATMVINNVGKLVNDPLREQRIAMFRR